MANTSQMRRFGLSVILGMMVAGCAGLQRKSVGADGVIDGPDIKISGSEDPSRKVMDNISKPYVSPLGEIPLDVTPLTEQWIRYFQGRGRRYMEVYLQRSSRYLPMMKNTLRENGLPEDLVYIALIESGFSPMAHSHANAVGYWQFIRATGKRFGLMVDPFIDERRDPVLSSRAAAEYFKSLYSMFGSWHLSMASYNVGEGRVARAVAKHYTRDFWELIKKRKALPKETKHYVPKFIAATLIAKDPAKYGFTEIPYEAPLAFDTVQLVNPISMTRMAQSAGINVDELKMLNPKFRGDYVPQYRGAETLIRVPVGMMKVAVAAIPQAYSPPPRVIASEHYFYRVKSGDSLSTIARKNRTSIANLKRLNGMGSRTFLRVGQKLKVPDRGGSMVTYEMPAYPAATPAPTAPATPETPAVSSPAPAASTVAAMPLGSPVRPTATDDEDEADQNSEPAPSVVAKDTPESRDPEANGDDETASTSTASPAPASIEKAQETHVVRRGENLTTIARKYGLSVNELRKLNRLNNRSVLRAGQTLRLKNEEVEASKSSAQETRRATSGVAPSMAKSKVSRQNKPSKVVTSTAKVAKTKAMVVAASVPAKKVAKLPAKVKSVKVTIQKHRVAKGETLASIAERYRVSIGMIAKHNQIKNKSRLLAGSEIVIPR